MLEFLKIYNKRYYRRKKSMMTGPISYIIFLIVINLFLLPVPGNSQILPKNCNCKWTEWMNSHNPKMTKNQQEDETIDNLRKKYDFCKQPKDVNCRAVDDETLFLNKGDHHCTLQGFTCNLFCFDFELRFQCCECIPEDIGKSFRLHLYEKGRTSSSGALNADTTKCLYYSENEKVFKYGRNCNSDHSIFNWVSGSKLKVKDKCFMPDTLSPNSRLILRDCDETEIQQGFEAKDTFIDADDYWTLLRLKHRYRYLTLSDDQKYVTMHYTNSRVNSKWLSKPVINDINLQTKYKTFMLSAFTGRECNRISDRDPNGEIVCSFDNLIGSACRKICKAGYQMETSLTSSRSANLQTQVKCIVEGDNGESGWSDSSSLNSFSFGQSMASSRISFPKCVQVTCDSSQVDSNKFSNGKIVCSKDNFINSICRFSCNLGYTLSRSFDSTKCESSGEWSIDETEMPFCQKTVCPRINVNHDSRLLVSCDRQDSDNREYLTTCTFSCKDGFKLNGPSNKSTCKKDGTWSSFEDNNFSALSCGPRDCPPVSTNNIRGLEVKCDKGQATGSTCVYTCQRPRYEMKVGLSVVRSVCQGNGQWSVGPRDIPKCYDMSCGQWNTYDQNLDIMCRKTSNNFRIRRDSPEIGPIIEEDDFSSVLPANMLSPLTRSRNNQGSTDIFSLPDVLCEVTCATGYLLKGAKHMKCNAFRPKNSAPYSHWIDIKTQSKLDPTNKNDLQRCEIIQCPPIVNFENGRMTCTKEERFIFGSRCSFTCDDGYTLEKTENIDIICNKNGEWSNRPPRGCKKISCSRLEEDNFENGKIICSEENNFGSKCQFVCDKGYKFTDENLISTETECQKNGAWTMRPPICRPVSCLDPFALDNRLSDDSLQKPIISCTNSHDVGSKCTYTCNLGYELDQAESQEAICQEDGKWSKIAPVCQGIVCDKLEALEIPPPNDESLVEANRLCTDPGKELYHSGSRIYQYPSQCVFYCSEGYYSATINKLKCNEDGKWIFSGSQGDQIHNSPPVCKPIRCTKIDITRTGTSVDCTNDNNHKSVCKFTCDKGYIMTGEDTIRCNLEGWDKNMPVCDKITCDPLPPINHGIVDCQDTWSENQLNCKFSCNPGYRIQGTFKELKCIAQQGETHGEWNIRNFHDKMPTCEPYTCSRLKSDDLKQLHCQNEEGHVISPSDCNYFGCTCTKKCNTDEAVRDGATSITCTLAQGSELADTRYKGISKNSRSSLVDWSGKLGQCQTITCPNTGDIRISNSKAILCSNHNIKGSVCKIQCNDNFRLVGPRNFTCQESGKWTNYDINYCEQITCSRHIAGFSSISNGNVNVNNGNLAGSVYRFSCDEGYRLVGQANIKCQWSDKYQDGRWSHDQAPSCVKITCDPPSRSNPNRIDYTCDSLGHNYKTQCTYKCTNPKNYALIGPEKIYCGKNQKSEGIYKVFNSNMPLTIRNLPKCELITCPPLPKPKYGSMTCDADMKNPKIHTKCQLTCGQTYRSEYNLLTCIKNPIQTQNTEDPSKGIWVDNTEVQRTDFKCILRDKRTLFAPCSVPDEEFSQIQLSDYDRDYKEKPKAECNYLTKKCSIECPINFEPNIKSIYCDAISKEWSEDISKIICRKKTCPVINDIENTISRHCNEENYINSECSFKCIDGFDMVGLPNSGSSSQVISSVNTICQPDGHWSIPLNRMKHVKCQQKRCHEPVTHSLTYADFQYYQDKKTNQIKNKRNISNSKGSNKDSPFMSKVNINCNKGYEKNDNCQLTCPDPSYQIKIRDGTKLNYEPSQMKVTCLQANNGGFYWSKYSSLSSSSVDDLFFEMDMSCEQGSSAAIISLAAIIIFILMMMLVLSVMYLRSKKNGNNSNVDGLEKTLSKTSLKLFASKKKSSKKNNYDYSVDPKPDESLGGMLFLGALDS